MYVLFALLIGLLVYALAAIALHRTVRRVGSLILMSALSGVAFLALLVAFNKLSAAIGVDLGPGHAVSYSIPEDYLARGLAGVAVLLVYALALLAPAIALALTLQRRDRSRA